MLDIPDNTLNIQPVGSENVRKAYAKPALEPLGDVRAMTLGPSTAGFYDSSGNKFSETFTPVPTYDGS